MAQQADELKATLANPCGLQLKSIHFLEPDVEIYSDIPNGHTGLFVTEKFRRAIFEQLHGLSCLGAKLSTKLITGISGHNSKRIVDNGPEVVTDAIMRS
ncbi:hypothetical protein KM043_017603 [Ampulex compressa]|nr:hypothetical protein KM043_017603 [Ampulex compressa]